MDTLEHITLITEKIDQEAVARQRIDTWRQAIRYIVHSHTADRDNLLSEICRDLENKYQSGELSMADRLDLLHEAGEC